MTESASPPQFARSERAERAPARLRRPSVGCAAAMIAGAAIAAGLNTLAALSPPGPSHAVWHAAIMFWEQDVVWLAVGALLLLALAGIRPPPAPGVWLDALARRPGWAVLALAAIGVAVAAAGTYAVLRGAPLSRDEIMADFDATILRAGRLFAEVPPEWRDLHQALMPAFLLPVPGAPVWVSSYLPVNAALRALVGLAVDPGWTGPLLVGSAILATFAAARRLWPERPDALLVSTLLLATSSQVLVTGMTSYAMSAHLALNLLWLVFFLRDDRVGHTGALAVGFLAGGLHQIVFHPLFAVPFIVHAWARGRRSLALRYVAAYAAIGIFWTSYWQLILVGVELPPGETAEVGAQSFAARAMNLILDFSWDGIGLTLDNLLRFVSWQHLLLLPLACAAFGAVRRDEGIARPLAAGIGLTLAAMFVLLPYQGHGWGYRYLHGLIGNACLLAGYGWIAVTARSGAGGRAAALSVLALATAFSALVMLPVRLAQAERMTAPYRAAAAAIARATADIVLVDPAGLFFAVDLVRNDPFLRNRPKVLDLSYIDNAQMRRLCARFTVAVFDRRQGLALGIRPDDKLPQVDEAFRAGRRALMKRLRCGTDVTIDAAR